MYKKKFKYTIFILLFFCMLSITSLSSGITNDKFKKQHSTQNKLKICNAWTRESFVSSKTSAIYMQIYNPTNHQIIIVGAQAPTIANNIQLCKSFTDDKGISRTTILDKIAIPARSLIALTPTGIHFRLINLTKKLYIGDNFSITLQTNNNFTKTINVKITIK
jgi:copper(I)-binding protein